VFWLLVKIQFFVLFYQFQMSIKFQASWLKVVSIKFYVIAALFTFYTLYIRYDFAVSSFSANPKY